MQIHFQMMKQKNIQRLRIYISLLATLISSCSDHPSAGKKQLAKDEDAVNAVLFDTDSPGTVLFNGKGTITIFPNPAKDNVNIRLSESWQGKNLTIEIFNQLGQKITSKKLENTSQVETIHVSNLPSGIYTMRLGNADGITESRKLKIYR